MLNKFINAYKMAYFREFGDDFYGRFRRFEASICEPKFHPSSELKNELKKLDLFLSQPAQVAIVGQFSSGKSTFLNALLKANILPTGATPVTARLTHIRYGQNFALRVDYKNGKELNLSVDEIANFVDQRVFNDDVKELCIYAPSQILKRVHFIDTPGLNSLSNSDTNITKEVLNSVCAVIWISLIDNAARASELDDLRKFLGGGEKTAICVLNQKDKLSQDELERVLAHSKTTFGDLFKQTIAISAKQANLARKNSDESLMQQSNFNAVLDAITRHFDDEAIKQNFVLKRCENIVKEVADQHEYFASVYQKADEILANFEANLGANLEQIKLKFDPKIKLAFNEIKEIAKFIADEIISSLKTKKMSRYQPKKSFVGNQKFERVEYEMMSLEGDEIFSNLIYNDVRLAKFFKAYKRELAELEASLCDAVSKIYAGLEQNFMIYKAQFENVQKQTPVHSDVEFAALRTHSGQVYESFLREYEEAKFEAHARIALFFEKLNLKVAANYENAIKIAVYFIKEKIDNSALAHEKDPLNFALFIPSAKESFERVLTSLNLYEFENEMLGHASFLVKILGAFERKCYDIRAVKKDKIATVIARHEQIKAEISDLNLKEKQ